MSPLSSSSTLLLPQATHHLHLVYRDRTGSRKGGMETSEIEPWAWGVGWWWLEFLPDLLTDGHGTYLHR